ncbi:hypothetical protein [Paraburkholderia sediminicola]|uniref:hypothetical protein n=1 Tax=Paraburkholderia sediminicola TaxID=458836 RepID=UPI0038B79B3D
MILWYFIENVAIALWNLLRATVGIYRPNGDGYVHSWWYCLDCLGNALAGGDPRETISSRAGKARRNGKEWACILCAFLGWVATLIAGAPTDHCTESVEINEGSRAIIPDGE